MLEATENLQRTHSHNVLWTCSKCQDGRQVYIIIDALDECPNISGMPTPREQVLEFLTYLVQLKLPNVHICVSSRFEVDIRKVLEPLASLPYVPSR
jgi:hypothetical protein